SRPTARRTARGAGHAARTASRIHGAAAGRKAVAAEAGYLPDRFTRGSPSTARERSARPRSPLAAGCNGDPRQTGIERQRDGSEVVSLLWAGLIVAAVTAVAITAMLLVRRRAPAGSYFEDGDRAPGVFGVLATGFAVLLGFVVFLAFESFDTSRGGGVSEANIVAEQFETATLMPGAVRGRLSGELVCYARAVVHQEWPR